MAPDRGQAPSKISSRSWTDLTPPLSEWILDAVSSLNFTRMTPVQASTLPLFMGNKDVVVEAVTGSGKTLSFLIPVVERILRLEETTKKHHVAAVVISPTRELATQIYNVLLSLIAFHGPSSAAVKSWRKKTSIENNEIESQEETDSEVYPASTPKVLPQLLLGGSNNAARDLSSFLKMSPNILISTPGRLLEILSSPYVHAPQSSFEMLVLDEADRLLDLGFKDDLTKILALLPKQRRTGLFSASVSEAVDQIIRVGLRNPVRVVVKVKGSNGTQDRSTPASLKITFVIAKASEKLPILGQLLQSLNPTPLRSIVYLSTCAAVDYFQHVLPEVLPHGMILVPLHGKHPANVREKNFNKFVNSAAPAILLTTDVAARGLDIPSVDLVVQVDPPSDPKVFIHRCGRAGRAGRRGLSVIMLQPGPEEDYIPFLEVRKTPVEKLEHPVITLEEGKSQQVTQMIRNKVLTDRALYDKAQKAFVSWVRSYGKHQASSIFRIADQDWADLAEGWGLLKMPKMPELRGWDNASFRQPEVDWDNYSYKDRQRERQRKESLLDENQNSLVHSQNGDKKRNETIAWSDKLEQKAKREVKRSKKDIKRHSERLSKLTEPEKLQQEETERMIEQVKLQYARGGPDHDVFEGFD